MLGAIRSALACGVLLLASILPSGRFETTLVTPTPQPIRSVFVDDSCEPPCWFGLVAGERTFEEVATFVRSSSDLFRWEIDPDSTLDSSSQYVIDGTYNFTWKDFQREDILPSVNSALVLREGILSHIFVLANEIIPLEEVLRKIGSPDTVRFDIGLYGIPYLSLYYPEPRLHIRLTTNRRGCTVQDIGARFWVSYIRYYSHQAWDELQVLDARTNDGGFSLSPETWAAWLNGEVNLTCREAWQQLPPTPGETDD